MKKTDNYSLPQWEKQDFIKMEDFNDAFGKTDAALKANADATATGLNAEIAARSEADAAEAENRSAALAALQTALSAAIGSGGKTCRIITGSYTGTGTSAAAIDCPFYPALALVQASSGSAPVAMVRTAEASSGHQDFSMNGSTLSVGWGKHSVSWRSTVNAPTNTMAERAGNSSGKVYFYVVLGYDDAAE